MAHSHSYFCALSTDFSLSRLGITVGELIDNEVAVQMPLQTLVSKPITVHLAYAETAQIQHYLSLEVSKGTTIYQALAQAGWLTQFADLAVWCEQVAAIITPTAKLWHVGIYAQKQPLSYQLQALDRIEVYRSLSTDPMAQRKNKSK